MTHARLNGIEIEYDVTGTGPAMLLSHGYGETHLMWRGQHAALGARYRLIAWDMRGHGGTDAGSEPAQYSLEATVADMRALLGHVGEERAVIGGLSLGGYMSLAFYGAHPQMVRALVICDSGPGYRSAAARAGWNQRAVERAVALEQRGQLGLAHAARGMLAQTDARVIDLLPSIRVPTLIVLGDKDEPFIAPCEYMAKKIPGARLEVIRGAGHMSNVDQPEAFNRVVLDFLDSLPR
jgi:pimeloyl-ACP methyl ester carboxylesterase